MPQLDFPTSPTPGQTFQGTNGVDYTWNATVGVWTAAPGTPLTITNPGSISGTAEVGATLTYTTGTATGGVAPYTPTWDWKKISDNTVVQSGGATYVIAPALLGDNVYVELTITDSAANSATAVTTTFPVPPAVIQPAGITGAVAPTTIPGTASFTWADAPGTLTASGCIEFSVDAGANWVTSAPVTNAPATTIQTRWVNTPLSGTCGDSAGNATITGTLTDSGGATTTFSFTMDRTPDAFSLVPNIETTTPNTVTTADPTFSIAGTNSPSFIWGAFTTTGGTPEYTQDGGANWYAIPSAPGSATVDPGATVSIRFTTGAAAGSEVYTVNVGASTTVGEFQSGAFTVTVASSPFPNTTFTPSTGPNATPAATNIPADPLGNLQGTAFTTNWNDGSPTLNATNMLMSIGAGVPPTLASISPVPSNTVNVAWLPSYINGLAHNANATGSFTDSTYTNTYTYTVKKQPANWTLAPITGAATSTQQTTGPFTPDSYNSPVTVSFSAPTTAGVTTMGNVIAEVNGAATPITVGTTTVTLNPGDQLEILGDSDSTGGVTVGVTVTLGSAAAQEWLVTTTAVPNAITAPTMLPSGPGINPALNSPAGIDLDGGTYAVASGSPGPHTSTDWELYEGGYPLGPSTATIGGVTPGTAGTPGTVDYKNAATADPNPALAQNEVYGKIPQDNALAAGQPAGTYPMFEWADALSINGYSDWYVPAKNELAILYFFLKPDGTANNTSSGSNPNSVAPYTPNTNYGPGFPDPTNTPTLFQSGNAQAFSTGTAYWSSSQYGVGTNTAWYQFFLIGSQSTLNKNTSQYARAIRRIPIAEYTAAGSPAIGTYLAGGFYAGQISTAGNGTADYALIAAPAAQGTYGYTGGTNASLSIAGADTDGFQVGMTIKGNTSNATGIILSINGTTIEYLPTSGTFVTGETISTDPASYTQLVPPPANPNSSDLETLFIAQASLTPSTTYWSRARYTASSTSTTSPWATWTSFTTVSSFLIPPGTPMGGGYFAGQIVGSGSTSGVGGLDNSGTIYNIIVAPVSASGLSGTITSNIQYRTTDAANGNTNARNENFGGLCTSEVLAGSASGGAAAYPVFNTFINGATGPNAGAFNLATGGAGGGTGIGGYNDWYLPAKNELAILYFFLKPDGTANNTSSGSNPNSVVPYTPNTNYGPGFPDPTNTPTLFQSGNAQAFSTGTAYWSSTESSINPAGAWRQFFSSGYQVYNGKTFTNYARAVRRIAA